MIIITNDNNSNSNTNINHNSKQLSIIQPSFSYHVKNEYTNKTII